MNANFAGRSPLFYWGGGAIAQDDADTERLVKAYHKPCYTIMTPGGIRLSEGGKVYSEDYKAAYPCIGIVPPVFPEALGDQGFMKDYGTRYAYMGGAMANGIASAEMVIALGKRGFLGSFGSGGLRTERIAEAIRNIQRGLPDGPYAVNLLHSPGNWEKEFETVSLFLEHKVKVIEASAFINLSPALVYYRLSGIRQSADGTIEAEHKVIAKVSREEVALKFMSPASQETIQLLLKRGLVTPEQAALAGNIPMADDITVEADSGGHTDNRPLVSLLPAVIALRDRVQQERNYSKPIRVGAGGGIGTPHAALGAFQMGAAYVVTGSVNQSCVEAGTSAYVRQALAKAGMADIMMAPCADMFELGAKVQVLKKGTMFPMHAQKLYELYRSYASIEEIPQAEIERLEKRIFKRSMEDIWQEVITYFEQVDRQEIERAGQDSKHKMALIFRWYLGNSSRWSIAGNPERAMDMQIWCGQSMGAFNQWVRGTYLEREENRRTADVAFHMMAGAAQLLRVNLMRQYGAPLALEHSNYIPEPREVLL